ncbi:2' O-ribose methyltransferase [Ceratobasidium sp. 414]|nr:2' O-ribose methyltransferase [Ceratobasidium sp. 414]
MVVKCGLDFDLNSSDPYVKQRSAGVLDGTVYRARSAFKLLEIDKKYKILWPGQVVCDLGAAPGGWSQVVAKQLRLEASPPVSQDAGDSSISGTQDSNEAFPTRQANRNPSMLVAVDLLPMKPVPGLHFIQGDFTHLQTQHRVSELVGGGVDVVLSDMCANVSGTAKDVESSLQLCEMAFGFASGHLRADAGPKSGVLVMKYFEHPDLVDFMKQELKPAFENVRTLRLAASRSESSEQYFLCTGFHHS